MQVHIPRECDYICKDKYCFVLFIGYLCGQNADKSINYEQPGRLNFAKILIYSLPANPQD